MPSAALAIDQAGSLFDVRFEHHLDLLFVEDRKLIATDYVSHKLRFIDLSAGTVTSVLGCRGVREDCFPTSLMLTNDSLYVGSYYSPIRKFTCELIS